MDSRRALCTLHKRTAQCIIWRVLFPIVCHYKRIVVFPRALWDRHHLLACCGWILEQFSINCWPWKSKNTAQQNRVYWHRYCDKDLISHESLHSTKTNGIWISPRQIKLQVSNSLKEESQFKNFFTKTITLTEITGLTFTPGQIEVEILCCGGKKRRVNT